MIFRLITNMERDKSSGVYVYDTPLTDTNLGAQIEWVVQEENVPSSNKPVIKTLDDLSIVSTAFINSEGKIITQTFIDKPFNNPVNMDALEPDAEQWVYGISKDGSAYLLNTRIVETEIDNWGDEIDIPKRFNLNNSDHIQQLIDMGIISI